MLFKLPVFSQLVPEHVFVTKGKEQEIPQSPAQTRGTCCSFKSKIFTCWVSDYRKEKILSMHPNMSYNNVHKPSQLSKGALQLQKKSHTSMHNMKGRLRTGTGADKLRAPSHSSSTRVSAALTASDHSRLGVDIWPEMLSLSQLVNSSTL